MLEGKLSDYHAGWQEWLAENLIIGVTHDKIVQVMMSHGFHESFVRREIGDMLRSPLFQAGRKRYIRDAKLRSLIDALAAQQKQSVSPHVCNKLPLAPPDFYSNYFFANRPVVIQGLMADWEAPRLWTPDYFSRTFGECCIEVTRNRSSDLRYEDNIEAHRATMRMKEFVQMVQKGGETNDYYLVARNSLLKRKEFGELLRHFHCPPGFLDVTSAGGHANLWFGPKGTVTPLHHDTVNVLLGQVYGRKLIRLISPFEIGRVYNDRHCYSAVDLEHIDLARFPLMREVSIIETILEPGEFVFLPLGWWHWVKSLDVSISLSFTNFCVKGMGVVWKFR